MPRHQTPGRRGRPLPALVLLTLLASAFFALAGTASAGASPTGGQAATALPPALTQATDGVWYCNYVSSNRLCVRFINGKSGVDAKYEKNGGSPITARFSYHDYTWNSDHWDSGTFRQVSGTTRSYAWPGTWPGCVRSFLNVSGGSQYASPQICP